MQAILGARSSRVVAARKLSRHRNRAQLGMFLVEGPQAIREAVAAGALLDVFATEQAGAHWAGLLASAQGTGVGVHLVDPSAIDTLTTSENPQGLAGVARWRQPTLESALAGGPRLALLMHEVSDPGNAGAMIRVADAVGAALVAFSDNSVDPTNGKCVRASTGSIFHLPVISAGPTHVAIAACQEAGLTVLAADVSEDSLDLFDAAEQGLLAGPTAWLLGNEAHGLPEDVRGLADRTVRIPILGHAESLNLATAGAVCMYTSVREFRRMGLA